MNLKGSQLFALKKIAVSEHTFDSSVYWIDSIVWEQLQLEMTYTNSEIYRFPVLHESAKAQ